MDELLAAIQEKTGLPADKAKGAAEACLGFLKEKLPAGIGNQIEGFLEGHSGQAADMVGGLMDTAKGALGMDD